MDRQGNQRLLIELTARGLESGDLPRAFALVQFVAPQASFGSWCRSAERLLQPGDRGESGILAVQDSRGVILGILRYRKVIRLPHHATMLGLDPVVCGASARHRIAVMHALLRALERLALQAGCNALASPLPRHLDSATRQSLREFFRSMGYGYGVRALVKPLMASATAPAAAEPAGLERSQSDTK